MRIKTYIKKETRVVLALLILLLISSLLSIRYGAVDLSLKEIGAGFSNLFSSNSDAALNERIFREIRLPRAMLCILVGASLALGGTLMQGLFRNPIVEPGLIGTSSGAAFGAAICFVLGASFQWDIGNWVLPLFACLGAVISTFLVFFYRE